jgi:hypothetical protein
MKKILISVIMAAFLAACSQGVVEEDQMEAKAEKKPAVQNPHAQNPHANPHGDDPHAGVKMKKERKFSVPKEVTEKYKSLILEVKNVPENSSVQTDVLIGQKSEVTGTPFEILVEHYLPDFVIDAEGTITTRSAEENNPVAKIKVFKFGEVFFDGWLYKNHPGEHGAFADNAYSISLVKSVTK